ncbi:PQQ-dependent sugar dehydrogenase [Arenibacter sp. S6351L]|uniref:PQQ-dependent sugar dehydrogenase n=1 Tax=Arenibacter sp. S6351L TaxID=2926407 RepID=UPI001FF6ADEA|nr:PQQ-dependent sugar dehydrogenase [Arenibacter sp. S6351L]MCK0136081.1 PQQ-dependent sugar dehydrogenase [Arenibacter sp. S6351L]
MKIKKLSHHIIIVALAITIIGCNFFEKQIIPLKSVTDHFTTPIDAQLLLDSTRIGRSTIISNLDVPWEIVWGPDNWIWFTEQGGKVSKVNPRTGKKKLLLEIQEVFRKRTTGLLGMVVHPKFEHFPYVFLNYTLKKEHSIISRLERYTYTNGVLVQPKVLLEIPGNTGHNGSRLTIAPDGKLMWATGDIGPNTDNAQNLKSLNGKILRLNIDGSIPKDNPFLGSPIWSWGQRNVQGLVYGNGNNLYTSEHGDATDDEINLMRRRGNYGWPNVTGFCDSLEEEVFCKDSTVVLPLKAWTPTIAPAGLDYYKTDIIPEWKNTLLLTTLKENDLRVLKLNKEGNAILSESILFNRELGRIRDICVSPIGDVYLSTSNCDWNPSDGFPVDQDDRIVRIFKLNDSEYEWDDKMLQVETNLIQDTAKSNTSKGEMHYRQYCSSCHKSNGEGVAGIFPSLTNSEKVKGSKEELINLALYGITVNMKKKLGSLYDQSMPGFHFLSDEEVAETLTYIRQQFGGDAESINAQEINDVRVKIDSDD